MIQVRIRKADEPTHLAVPLCEIPFDDIELLLDSIAHYGIFFDGESENVYFSYRYVYLDHAAYFEIEIIPGESELFKESEDE